jgi:hypothetical protein
MFRPKLIEDIIAIDSSGGISSRLRVVPAGSQHAGERNDGVQLAAAADSLSPPERGE